MKNTMKRLLLLVIITLSGTVGYSQGFLIGMKYNDVKKYVEKHYHTTAQKTESIFIDLQWIDSRENALAVLRCIFNRVKNPPNKVKNPPTVETLIITPLKKDVLEGWLGYFNSHEIPELQRTEWVKLIYEDFKVPFRNTTLRGYVIRSEGSTYIVRKRNSILYKGHYSFSIRKSLFK